MKKEHGMRARKGWIKLHVAFDLKRKKEVRMEATDKRAHDSEENKYGKRWLVESFFFRYSSDGLESM